MSGHSKFANIKHKKEKNDAAKGKIFTVIGREIAVAVKEGGPDPANNSKLRDVIAKAKSNNMPNDTIERGIKKAAGDANSVNYVQNTYEGYGPNGIAIIVETLTDNKNRTVKKAAALKEVPIGCVIVYDGRIIARGYNRRTVDKNVLAHAEIIAMRRACRILGDWRLEGCTMYVTLEPCPMCAGAIVQARIPKVVIGCMNPKAGCAGSVLDMLHEDGFNHQVETEVGLLGDECSQMLKDFFKALREEGKRKKQTIEVSKAKKSADSITH